MSLRDCCERAKIWRFSSSEAPGGAASRSGRRAEQRELEPFVIQSAKGSSRSARYLSSADSQDGIGFPRTAMTREQSSTL